MSRKTLYAFIISFLLLIAVIILNRFSLNNSKTYSEEVDHTRQVITLLESIASHFKSAQLYSPNYQDAVEQAFFQQNKTDAQVLPSELAKLKVLVSNNPEQWKRADSLSELISSELTVLMSMSIAELVQSGMGERLKTYHTVHEIINRSIAEEDRLLIERNNELGNYARLNNIVSTALAVIGVAILFFTFFPIFFLSRKSRWLEGLLESILNTSQNGIVHYKAVRKNGKVDDFKVGYVNKAIDSLLDIRGAEVTGKKLRDISSYVRSSELMERYVHVVDSGEPALFETFYRRGKVERWLLVALVKLGDGLTASFQDISQLKKYEEELKANIRNLEKSNVELEQYAYVASHDLQEPLRKIRSFGSFLQDTQADRLDEKGREQLGKIMSSAERMSALIRDILNFSSLKKEDLFVETDLRAVVDGVLQDLDMVMHQKKASVEISVLPEIEAIPLQMTQLFHNLLTNSLKFAKEDTPLRIRISSRVVPQAQLPQDLSAGVTYYEIAVGDNGIGFSPEYAEQIFGLFKRLNDRQFYPGSGIGLALCKKVVDNHHGAIRADGIDGDGAKFYIYLPEQQP